MHRLRMLMLVGASTALVVTSFAVPASAAPGKGTIAFVNGRPGVGIDICINGREVKSGFKYGRRAFWTLKAGRTVVKVFKRDPRTCKGVRLAKSADSLAAGTDETFVIGKRSFLVFDNAELGQIPPTGPDFRDAYVVWRHAADLGDVNFLIRLLQPRDPITPAANAIWQVGDELAIPVPAEWGFVLSATRPEKTHQIAESRMVTAKAGRRYEWYLVGTKPRNAKFVVFSRAVSLPTP